MSSAITKSSKKRQETSNLESDCIKSRRDKIGITRHIMMHQVLYIVQLPNEEGAYCEFAVLLRMHCLYIHRSFASYT